MSEWIGPAPVVAPGVVAIQAAATQSQVSLDAVFVQTFLHDLGHLLPPKSIDPASEVRPTPQLLQWQLDKAIEAAERPDSPGSPPRGDAT